MTTATIEQLPGTTDVVPMPDWDALNVDIVDESIVQGGVRGRLLGRHGYYKHKDTGYILFRGCWATDRDMMEQKGYRWLDNYGHFEKRETAKMVNGQQLPRNILANEQMFAGLVRSGGAHEMSVAQLVEMGWHRNPPTFVWYEDIEGGTKRKQVRFRASFPQLAKVRMDTETCSCGAQFNTVADMAKHASVMHREEAQNERLARAIGSAMRPAPVAVESSPTDPQNRAARFQKREVVAQPPLGDE